MLLLVRLLSPRPLISPRQFSVYAGLYRQQAFPQVQPRQTGASDVLWCALTQQIASPTRRLRGKGALAGCAPGETASKVE